MSGILNRKNGWRVFALGVGALMPLAADAEPLYTVSISSRDPHRNSACLKEKMKCNLGPPGTEKQVVIARGVSKEVAMKLKKSPEVIDRATAMPRREGDVYFNLIAD